MYTIQKEFSFSASHILNHLPAGHPCSRMHGHNYVVVLVLRAPDSGLDPVGFVRDYRDLDKFKHWVDDTIDHHHLNDVLEGTNPSAENIARWLFERWGAEYPDLSAVRVSETPKTWAEYSRAGSW